ncbi:HAD-IIA family hydrolase [Paraburkholderia caribensis]|uniref:HAD-superfamily hydrolase, subfamily IIA n=2 Tax=Paraburkholderia TaxID=1822464 RepID=B2JXP8_PARP8|nr:MULTISPECIES: HAD-IIA family hydrolase [Paraburkholderia]ACC76406.1 HAD-superfamily hydrolase, subfamily IIA [Paraburkholderia phymatum STM815]MCO4882868.1 HAD-IIA family hydrolase [Paraburkholderia caribensis]PTB23674.1 phosphotransferase [Paraburkholderia caribensis]
MDKQMQMRAWPRIRGVVSDLDGVVYRGKQVIEESIEAFQEWRRLGVPFCFVTNNSTHTEADVVKKLADMGLPIEPQEVVTSAGETARLLRTMWPEGTPVYVIGAESLTDAVAGAGMNITDRSPAAVVMGLDRAISHEKMRVAVQAILDGATLIGTNPDLLLPTAQGFEPGAGAQLTAVAVAARVKPIIVGKPETHMIEAALARLGTAREETIMVGDQIPTDIQAGKRAGLHSVLITTGVPAVEDPALLPPDFVVQSLRDIPVFNENALGASHG